MVWMISKLYDGQFGEVIGSSGRSRKFNITGGVRQGCVLSPRLFCAVLQFAMRKWRLKVGDLGFDLSDGMPHLIDLRFADDILLFARSALEVGRLLDSLVAELSEVGLLLNADKTVVLTSQSQPPSTITTEHGITLKVLPGNVAQKWLGCMLTAFGSEQKSLDLQYHLQQAAKAYHANKWILEDRKVPISQRPAILILLFHRLLALQVGIVPCTRNTYKPWTFIFENSADPLWALRRTLTGHSHGVKFCTLGMNEQHTLFASRRLRAGRECVVVYIGNWHLMLFNAPPTTGYEEFCIGNPWGKDGSDAQNCAGRANWRCTVVTKDWLIGRWQHKTVNFGGNISIRF